MWLEINNHIDDIYGYYHGFGADAGLYAFNRGEGYEDYIMAPTFDPTIYIEEYGDFKTEPYTYNEQPVFRNENKSHYIFKSVYNDSWILFERLQEPTSYYALDLSTMLGDGWWQLQGSPQFRKENFSLTIQCEPQGTYKDNMPTLSAINSYDCFDWDWDSGQRWYDYPMGLYKNSDGECRVLGTPIWITTSPERSMTRKEVWALHGEGQDKVYGVGLMQLAYNYDISAWVIGTVGSGRWYEGPSRPTLGGTAHYDCCENDEHGNPTHVVSSYVDIKFYRAGKGNEQTSAFFGEVSQWY